MLAPTLVTSCTALPPEGALFSLGRPGGKLLAPTLVAARTALPPEGALFSLGRPGGRLLAPTLVAAHPLLPAFLSLPPGAGWGEGWRSTHHAVFVKNA